MLLTWVYYCLSLFSPPEPVKKELNTIELIDSVIEHYAVINSPVTMTAFSIYFLPCKSFQTFKRFCIEFITLIDTNETPALIKLQTIVTDTQYYTQYFTKRKNNYMSKDEAKQQIFGLLKKLKVALNNPDKSETERINDFYYEVRAAIMINYCVAVLETLTHD
jgi:hypothetical protein